MPRSLKSLKRCCVGLGLVLAACNVYNPSGDGAGGASVDEKLADGENNFRSQNYIAAMASYSAAIDQDSTNSMAYYGYAKSAMRRYNVNASTLLTEVNKAQDKSGVPFIGAAPDQITAYLQASSKARKALGELTNRDSLTRWYYYTIKPDSKEALKDPLFAKRVAFIKDYWTKAALVGAKGMHTKAQFPLSDLKLGSDKVVADFGFIELIYAITHLRDLNGDNIIDSKDDLLKNLTFSAGGAGGLQVDNLKDIAADIATDSVKRNQVNALIQNVSSGLGSASKVLDLLGTSLTGQVPGAKDSLASDPGLSQKVTQNMDSVIGSLGNAVTFYQFGDGKDNDGDGCIDEEILDGKDNDGDGFVDEDARLNNIAPYLDEVDNDHNGKGKQTFSNPDPDEALDGSTPPALIYTTKPAWVIGAKYKDKATRIATQADSLDIRSPAELAGFYKDKLDAAKKNIGGCWNNY